MHIIAAKAVAFGEALKPEFQEYAKQVIKNANHLAETLKGLGYTLVSGGTDTHLVLIDLTNKGVVGKEVQAALDRVGITLNKNTIPFDPNPPFNPSGIRFGTPAVTTRGMKEPEMEKIAHWMDEVITNIKDESMYARVKAEVAEMCSHFPVPGIKV